jgi:hypothetical protein
MTPNATSRQMRVPVSHRHPKSIWRLSGEQSASRTQDGNDHAKTRKSRKVFSVGTKYEHEHALLRYSDELHEASGAIVRYEGIR